MEGREGRGPLGARPGESRGWPGSNRASAPPGLEPYSPIHVRTTLLSSNHWLMEDVADARVVWLSRRPLAFASLTEIANANSAVVRQIRPQHASCGVVVDMRQAPPRNDAGFEQAMLRLRTEIEARFARTAVLLATQVGVLQVNRITRADGTTSFATTDEAEALRFARGEVRE